MITMGRRNFTWHLLFSADLILGPYNASSGTLSTPGYPNVYNGEQDIEWMITTQPYTTITLFFQDLQVASRFYVICFNYFILHHEKSLSEVK